MKLFHATLRNFEIGCTYTANEKTPYYEQNEENGKVWVDTVLNKFKPENAPNRQNTFFACDSLENCYVFILPRYKDKISDINYYEVEMKNPVLGVMCLTEMILELGNNHNRINEVLKEYWNPTKSWKYLEFLSTSMTIVEAVYPTKMQILISNINYLHDFDMYKNWLKELN